MADTTVNFDETEAEIGHGKSLWWSDTANGNFTKIAGTVNIALPDSSLGSAENTNDDTPDFHKDYTPGMYEPGTLSFTYIYGETAFDAMHDLYLLASVAGTRASATKYWKYKLPGGAIAEFRGFITKHGMDPEQEDTMTVEGEMQVRGKVTFTKAP